MPYVKGINNYAEYIEYFSQKLDLIKELMEGIPLDTGDVPLYRSNSIYFGKFGAIVAHYREEPAAGFRVTNAVQAVYCSCWEVSVNHHAAPRYDTEVCTEVWIQIYQPGIERVCVLQLVVFDNPKLPRISTSHTATWLFIDSDYDNVAVLHFC